MSIGFLVVAGEVARPVPRPSSEGWLASEELSDGALLLTFHFPHLRDVED